MQEHNKWLNKGFVESVFLAAGKLQPGLGGAIIAHNISRNELESRINADPFVKEDIVTAEISEIEVIQTDPQLDFLKDIE